ncbi:RNA 2',3'-cyclic phosphodiesterase [Flavisolibacter sp. BT320]|nr:RNA 2',3'-cyclic phosphodiesterase [Flavisolibacter longurius]
MQESTQNTPVRMYFVAVVLPQQIDEKLLPYKRQMQEKYGCKVGLKSPAHITIVPPFWMEEEKEHALRQDIEQLAQTMPAFSVTTAGFSAFKPRTIFVEVEENATLHQLKKNSDAFFRGKEYKMKIENRPFHPHITIATRDMHKKDFWEAWSRFEKEPFLETADVNGLSLLRHNGRVWDVVFTAPFLQVSPTDFATQH